MNKNKEESSNNPLNLIIGNSSSILKLKETIKKVSPYNIPILIKGETGTGKELVANAIHLLSNRAEKPYIVANCGGLSSELALSDFFGHSKGAFTGATKNREGYFCAANKGSLFLDELGELKESIQSSLLRVLEGKEIIKLGTEQTIKIDTRIIAATNKDLEELIKKGGFREDLFHRLNTCILDIPALRERPEDIGLLTKYFLKKTGESNNNNNDEKEKQIRNISISDQAIKDLENYPWPGNIRELINVINYLTIMICDNSEITPEIIKEFKPELYKKILSSVYIKKDNNYLSNNISQKESILETVDGDFIITNFKRISSFINKLNGFKNRKKVFTGLIIRYYLLKYNRNKEETAKKFGLSPIIFGQILEKYKIFIQNNMMDSFFDIVPVFGMDLKKARERLNKLNRICIKTTGKKETKDFSDLNKQIYGETSNLYLLDKKDLPYYKNFQTLEDKNPFLIEKLQNNKQIQEFIKELERQKEPIKIFIGLFIRYYLHKNDNNIYKVAKHIGVHRNTVVRYISFYNSDNFDKYLPLIPLFSSNLDKAKKEINSLSSGSIKIRQNKKSIIT